MTIYFRFNSVVLLGKIKNRVYHIGEPSSCLKAKNPVYEVAYDGSKSSMRQVSSGVELALMAESTVCQGDSYSLKAGELHSSEVLSQYAVTVLATSANGDGRTAPRVISTHREESKTFDRTPMPQFEVLKLLADFAGYLKNEN